MTFILINVLAVSTSGSMTASLPGWTWLTGVLAVVQSNLVDTLEQENPKGGMGLVMARARKRFCPKGHDMDAVGGSLWYKTKTLKGTVTMARACRLCRQSYIKKWRKEKKYGK